MIYFKLKDMFGYIINKFIIGMLFEQLKAKHFNNNCKYNVKGI